MRYLFSLAETAKAGSGDFNTEGTESTEKRKPLRAASVEAVFMPSEGRQTICVSTQAGCAVDCQFCMTAQLGLIRNLTAGEILAQVLLPLEEHKERLAPRTNIVLMGQGEPLLNFDAVMAALRIMLDQRREWASRRDMRRFRRAGSCRESSGWRRKRCGPSWRFR